MVIPKVERLVLNFGMTRGGPRGMALTVNYTPVIEGSPRPDLTDQFVLPHLVEKDDEGQKSYEDLATRCERLRDQLETVVAASEEIEIDGQKVTVGKVISKLWIFAEEVPVRLQVDVRQSYGTTVVRTNQPSTDLTEAQQRLLDSINTSIDSFAWKHIRQRFEVPAPPKRPKIFISHRNGYEEFAEAVAMRLVTEGFAPWFDKWEILAGDSLPGKIEEGFANSVAFVVIITRDFKEGKWATEELEAAIDRRVREQKGYPIIPLLLHDCDKPALIGHLRHVDFTDQNPQTFEAKMAEVIDGINRLDRNPFP